METEMTLQNPWWRNARAIDEDEKIAEALAKKPAVSYRWEEKKHHQIFLGPRQVGKTTMLKFFIRDLLQKGTPPRNILYFSCEPLREKNDIITLITTFERMAPEGEKFILLDEITKVKEWELAIKFFLDSPLQRNKRLAATGSNALFLKHGTERMPGRNIEASLALPLSFRQYLLHFGSEDLRRALSDGGILREQIDAAAIDRTAGPIRPFSDEIERAFRNYAKTGGFLRAVYEQREHGFIRPGTYEIYVRWILGDLGILGKSEETFRGIIRGVVKNYGSATSYLSIARETGIPSHTTVNEYLCTTQDLLLTNTLCAVEINKQIPLLRKKKKYYFSDPFLYSAFTGYLYGEYRDYSEGNMERLVEGVVCEALARRGRKNLDHSFFLWYYKSKKETDFAIKNGHGVSGIEIKWTERASIHDVGNFFIFKDRILLTKRGYDYQPDKRFVQLPLPLFLALLGP